MKLNWINTLPDGETARKEFAFLPDKEGVENHVVNLYPEITFQTMEGFGGAITDAAGYVYSLMKEDQKHQLMETYFSPEQMKYGIVRIHMDSCDFSTEMYEAMSDPSDRELKTFSFSRTEKYILPMLADAENAAGKKLKLMLSPWSPPAFMKTNGERKHGGSLKPEYREFWADYICRYILEFRKRGYEVQRISLQNEPKAVQTWDSCIYTAREEKEFLRDFMYPALQKHDLCDVEVFIWDHNKERVYDRVRTIVDSTTESMVQGAAVHWYSGDHFEALDLVRRRWPQMRLVVSESCIEYSKYDAADGIANAARLAHEIIGDLNHGVSAFYDWNILLDETGGPNHVGNLCQAPFLYDRSEKELCPQPLLKAIGHFSRYLAPGARRIGFSRYTEQLELTAFQNPDGSCVAILLNRKDTPMPVVLRLNEQIASFTMPAQALATASLVCLLLVAALSLLLYGFYRFTLGHVCRMVGVDPASRKRDGRRLAAGK